jgi:A/G-specific adenine glycosylase
VLVSEVMLQQTQVARVVPAFERWMARWPAAGELARSPAAEAIREWGGLGYNRRAVNLHRAATMVVGEHGGEFPLEPAALERLPGVGPYTAAAVACFAGERREAVVDTNVRRVLARVVLGQERADAGSSEIAWAAEELLPENGARAHNLALMDLGATVCTAHAPACAACPVARHCGWRAAGSPRGAKPGTSAIPFRETARFTRGRIVAMLRERPTVELAEIYDAFAADQHERIVRCLASLERDGLIEHRPGGAWSLPGQGRMSMASPKL